MRYIFAIQGEGRGHFTQALVMQEMLRRRGDEVVAFLVGKSKNRELPRYFVDKVTAPIITFKSPNFAPSHNDKRPNLTKTVLRNVQLFPLFIHNMNFIRRKINELNPDLVVNFYELLTGLTYGIMPPHAPMVCIAHQYLFLHRKFEFPPHTFLKAGSLRFFTNMTALGASRKLALSFYELPNDYIQHISVVPPLLRPEVRELQSTAGDYLHGYMLNSGFIKEVDEWHEAHSDVPLGFFWDKKDAPDRTDRTPNYTLFKINDTLFLERMAGCKAYATTAGFESVCEAIYLGKPVLMVPAHIEQECNAFDAQHVGAGISSDRFDLSALLDFVPHHTPNREFREWADQSERMILAHFDEVIANSKL